MDRAALERLDREALIARAEAAGVTRARILTRPELIDELLLRSASPGDPTATTRARGFFGVARDLLARVVERGLHLPDAADLIRGTTLAQPPPSRKTAPAALPTVTLAEIYAAQGHRERAIDTLKRVLEREADHGAARALLRQLEDASYAVPPPALPPEEEAMLDQEKPAPRSELDECVAIPVDPTTVFVYWGVRDATVEVHRATGSGGTISLRVVVIVPTWEGPRSTHRDRDVHAPVGEWFARDLPAGSVVRAAIGFRARGVFVPIAHSPALETPTSSRSPRVADVLVRWTPAGAVPVRPSDADAVSIARALDALVATTATTA